MIYIISITKHTTPNSTDFYKGFDTTTNSLVALEEAVLKRIILATKIQVVNASIQDDYVIIKDWGNGITIEKSYMQDSEVKTKYTGPKYIMIATEASMYKLVDYKGRIRTIWDDDLEIFIKSGEVANCILIETKDGNEIITKDYYKIQKDEKFEETIKSKYNSFVAKTTIIGYRGITFDYVIENHEVMLSKYTGSAKDIILPTFVTAIGKDAFKAKGIETINLNEGIKVIGSEAFAFNPLVERVEIPEKVELIGNGAFAHNYKLLKILSGLNKDRVKLRNNKTIVLSQNN